jgi:pimeloyl-ACP methyl ester carboxylesterase
VKGKDREPVEVTPLRSRQRPSVGGSHRQRARRPSHDGRRHYRFRYGPWLRELVHALALEHPIVAAHALSGRAALLAARSDQSIGGLVLVNPAGLIRLRVRPLVIAATVRWLIRRDEASSAALLLQMAGRDAQLPAELSVWLALVGVMCTRASRHRRCPRVCSHRSGAPSSSLPAARIRSSLCSVSREC